MKPPQPIDPETARVNMTLVRLSAIIAGTVALATFASDAVSARVTKTELSKILDSHSTHPHPATENRLSAIEANVGEHSEQLATLGSVPDDIREIRHRVDLLLQTQLYEAETSPKRRRHVARAAQRVRTDARQRGEAGDPLAGMDGL